MHAKARAAAVLITLAAAVPAASIVSAPAASLAPAATTTSTDMMYNGPLAPVAMMINGPQASHVLADATAPDMMYD